ncbi:MAG TPA: cysteine desulfurase NifS [Candidatus Acidoferrales bacterium]|nr:cysteine desulfurase NifS [Candidatus Acidoferrales bacterium]
MRSTALANPHIRLKAAPLDRSALTAPSANDILHLVGMLPMKRIYFDYNATTPMAPEVLLAMMPYLTEEYGNASSIHGYGQNAREAVEQARSSVAALVGARAADIMFTSGGTESNNHAILGAVAAVRGKAKHVITSAIEHVAALDPCRALAKSGIDLTVLPVNRDGLVNPEDVRGAIRPDTVLITIMLANNETGTIEPIEEIGNIAAEKGIVFHTDAVQAAGKIPIDVEKLGVDLLSISAHKFCGPKGVGALYIRKGTQLEPLIYGGHSERDRRPGTEDVAAIAGMGKAAELARGGMRQESEHASRLRDRLEHGLLDRVPQSWVNGARARRVPNTSNLTFPFIEGEAMVIALDLKGIACSTGAACSSGAVEPSHVLIALGLAAEDARATLRLSLGHQTTEAEIDFALETIPPVIDRLRNLSPTYKKPAIA